jgi:methylmalonyl-CoA epimerase
LQIGPELTQPEFFSLQSAAMFILQFAIPELMKIDHLGIAVRSLDDSVGFYEGILGQGVSGKEIVHDQGVTVAMLPVGDSRIELLEPLSDDSVVGRFIARRGEGLHHICYEVDDLHSKLEELGSRGVRLLEGYPRRGAEGKLVAFLHPSSANGVLVELVEKTRLVDKTQENGRSFE